MTANDPLGLGGQPPLTRRALLRSAVAAGGVALLAGCGEGAPAPTPAPAAPTATALVVAEPTVTGGLDLTPVPASPVAASPVAPAAPAPEPASPAAGAAPDQARLDQLMAVSATLVGGGRLDPARGTQFLGLVDADPARKAALDRLLASPPDPAASAPAVVAYPWAAPAAATPAATPLAVAPDAAKDLLRFWYLGTFDGAAVDGRDRMWFTLAAWQATSYTAAPSICKSFGSWATAPAARS